MGYEYYYEIEELQEDIDALTLEVEELKQMAINVDKNLNTLKALLITFGQAADFKQSAQTECFYGAAEFIEGACYCGAEVGGAEKFANISTKIEEIATSVTSTITNIETLVSAYASATSKISQEKSLRETKINNKNARIAALRKMIKEGQTTVKADNKTDDDTETTTETASNKVPVTTPKRKEMPTNPGFERTMVV